MAAIIPLAATENNLPERAIAIFNGTGIASPVCHGAGIIPGLGAPGAIDPYPGPGGAGVSSCTGTGYPEVNNGREGGPVWRKWCR